MAEPNYRNILDTLVTTLRATGHYRHVGIDEQQGPNALQCPAVFVSLPGVTWTPERLSGGVGNDRSPFLLKLTFGLRLWIFSAQGPTDIVAQRLTMMQTLAEDLRNGNRLGGLLLYTLPQSASLPDPVQDDSGAIFGQAMLSAEAALTG